MSIRIMFKLSTLSNIFMYNNMSFLDPALLNADVYSLNVAIVLHFRTRSRYEALLYLLSFRSSGCIIYSYELFVRNNVGTNIIKYKVSIQIKH